MRRKGFILPLILVVAALVVVLIGVFVYFKVRPAPQNYKTSISQTAQGDDSQKKDTVDNVNSLIKQYYVNNGSYPKEISDLKTSFNINDSKLSEYTNTPYYYKSDGKTYEYYAKLGTGEIFKGDTAGINKYLDFAVKEDVNSIVAVINVYYGDTKRLPKSLEEISTLPDLSFFILHKNPITGEPYNYIPRSDGKGFIVSGKLSDGSEYKMDIPIN